MSTPSGSDSQKSRKDYLSGKPKVPSSSGSKKPPPVAPQPGQRPPVAPPASENTSQESYVNDDQQQFRHVATRHDNPESEPPFRLPTLPSTNPNPNPQNRFADPFKWQPLSGEPLSPLDGSHLTEDIWRPQSYARSSNTRNNSASQGTPLNQDIWRPQSYARDDDSNTHSNPIFTPVPTPRGASSRMHSVHSNQQLSPLAQAGPSNNDRFVQRLPALAPARPKPNMTYAPQFNLWPEASQPANVRSAPRFTMQSQAKSAANINSTPQPPVPAPTTTLDCIPSKKAEELRDRLFKLTSDYQRLYSTFMANGDASPNAARWKSFNIDLPYLFEVRQQLINFLTATKRFENGEEIADVRGFKESQKPFFKNLEETVAHAVEKVTWLRRDLEGPDGFAYQYRNWYYQVIGNNPRSTCLPFEKEVKGNEGGDGDGDGRESLDKAARHGDEHGNLASPSLISEDEKEMRAEKRM
ncbi:hypothetical protein BOTCAL_0327g00070 [Botryotinia calthae]|uniref:Uncharacterized protein n=1 Tax=Botryotinia calthae TaxID=38488 RepID=A0A4Y8CVP0_9HELO|nr:hypothetical protein BOTCAL_0327g00070 [Botryotinia calthae]